MPRRDAYGRKLHFQAFTEMNKNERFLPRKNPVRTGFDAACSGFDMCLVAFRSVLQGV
jgi:hypothetical protein